MLEVLIGMVALFVIVASLSSLFTEFWVRLWGLRERNLRRCLIHLLTMPTPGTSSGSGECRAAERCADKLLVAYARQRASQHPPGHLPPATFARLLLSRAEAHPPGLRYFLAELELEVGPAALPARVAAWFADVMDATSTAWRLRTRLRLFAAGLLLAVAFNADALRAWQVLHADPALATALADDVRSALDNAGDNSAAQSEALIAIVRARSDGPILGWAQVADDARWWSHLPGWLICALAASLGGPFWVDVLRSLLRVRSAAQPEIPEPTVAAVAATTASPEVAQSSICVLGQGQMQAAISAGVDDPIARRLVMAAAAQVAYAPVPEACAWWARCGYRAQPCVDGGVGSHGLVVQLPWGCLLALRGTEMSAEDWAIDARFGLVPPPWQGRPLQPARASFQYGWIAQWWARLRSSSGDVPAASTVVIHQGFAEALSEGMWRQIVEHCGHPQGAARHPIWLCGHSLGGALATLIAARISDPAYGGETAGLSVGEVLTLGQPRVGNTGFAHWYDEQLGLRERHQRIVHALDPVAVLPPLSLGYAHVGQESYLDERGQLLPPGSSSPWYATLDRAGIILMGGAARAQAAAEDHSVSRYVALLAAAWPLSTDSPSA